MINFLIGFGLATIITGIWAIVWINDFKNDVKRYVQKRKKEDK